MTLRSSMALAAFAAAIATFTNPASAGCAGAACYQRVHNPAVYATVSEPYMMMAPRSYNEIIPAEYSTVEETVQVAPARKVWQVTRDAYGREIGCWVVLPARFATRQRTVMVRPQQVIPHTVPAVYGVHQREVKVAPASTGWAPLSRPVHDAPCSDGLFGSCKY